MEQFDILENKCLNVVKVEVAVCSLREGWKQEEN